MVRGGGKGDWSAQDRANLIQDGGRGRAARVEALLRAKDRAPTVARLSRPGISEPKVIRYASTADAERWAPLGAGRPLIETLLESIEDGADRAMLAWPERPGNALTLTALALREARSAGRLASASIAIWPWRPGLTRAARSILLQPADVADVARIALNDQQSGASWIDGRLTHEALNLAEIRLRDLIAQNAPRRIRSAKGHDEDVVVRSPTLLETSSIFAPAGRIYPHDPDQVLRRVRDYTHMGETGSHLGDYVAAIGDPVATPFAIYGMPPATSAAPLERLLAFPRFAEQGLDALIIDATRQSRAELAEDWERLLGIMLAALAAAPGRRPPVIALCDDPFSLRAAVRAIRAQNTQLKPRRSPPIETGAFLAEAGFLPPAMTLAAALPHVNFTADIKDAALVGVRQGLVALGKKFRQARDSEGSRAVSRTLTFLRRSASLPVGLEEAVRIADVLFDDDGEGDAHIRAMFRPKMALKQLAVLAEASPAAASARELLTQIDTFVEKWGSETPVSMKLAGLMETEGWSSDSTILAVPDRRVAEILLASDRALHWNCRIVYHDALAAALADAPYDRLLLVGPTPAAIRTLLISENVPSDVLLLGDSAGSALIVGELAPISRIAAFAPVAGRAVALQEALKRGGMDERLDAGESEFRMFPIVPDREIDLTREGGSYTGDMIILGTGSHRIRYRPTSDVLRYSPGEVRPFERVAARTVRAGDQILVLDAALRERLREPLAASRASLAQLAAYHSRIAAIREMVPGVSVTDKAREVLRQMQEIDPQLADSECQNIQRWLTADLSQASPSGARQPRAARDWPRFQLFMQVNGVEEILARSYWDFAIKLTRAYRMQEGHVFNERVVQFVLDPEGSAKGSSNWAMLRPLWLALVEAVDDVRDVERVRAGEDK